MDRTSTANFITELQAIEIAESVVEGTVVQMELDGNDGQYVYELELTTIDGRAEIGIDAFTGSILKKDVEWRKPVHKA